MAAGFVKITFVSLVLAMGDMCDAVGARESVVVAMKCCRRKGVK